MTLNRYTKIGNIRNTASVLVLAALAVALVMLSATPASASARLAYSAPPAGLGPNVSGELAEAAGKNGLSPLEAAGYERLGVWLA